MPREKELHTVKYIVDHAPDIKQHIAFVNKAYMVDTDWMSKVWYISKEELLKDYALNLCWAEVKGNRHGQLEYGLVIYVDADDEHLKDPHTGKLTDFNYL